MNKFNIFEQINCKFCKGTGRVNGGDYTWNCKQCSNGKVFKHLNTVKLILSISALVYLILFILNIV